MKILVTGAGGFIGSHLTEALVRDGHDVTAMAHYCSRDTFGWLDDIDCNKVRGDVRSPEQMRTLINGKDRVYHLAAMGSVPWSFEAPREFIETNTNGTLNVAIACVEYGVELVHTSTSEVYGSSQTLRQSERHPLSPQSPYAASKIAADKMVEALSASRGLHAVILRPFNTYGPRQSARAVIPRMVLQCLSGSEKIRLGNLTTRRDFLFVDDTVAAFMAMRPMPVCKTFNAGSSHAYSIKCILDVVRKLTGSNAEVETDDDAVRPDGAEVICLRADINKIEEEYNWSRKIRIEEGLGRTIEWYRGRKVMGGLI